MSRDLFFRDCVQPFFRPNLAVPIECKKIGKRRVFEFRALGMYSSIQGEDITAVEIRADQPPRCMATTANRVS